ncbi:MAG: nucleoside deaminase [Bacilli bacterium]
MEIAIKLAKKAYKNGDVPVGAVIVKDDKIIAKAYNKKEKNKIATQHAEIMAIEKACKKLKTWYLNDCILYTTMEPCLMCTGAIIQSRLNTIIYATENNNFGELNKNVEYFKKYNKNLIIKKGILKEESVILLKDFFKDKRK